MILSALQDILPYASDHGVEIYSDFVPEPMLYKFLFRCGGLASSIIVSDWDLFQHRHPQEYLMCILKDGIDLIYQAWKESTK